MTYHKQKNILSCHQCGHQRAALNQCPDCSQGELVEIGHGTERLTETLKQCFPDARILRVDRDSTRRKGSMENMLTTISSGEADILIGTQMLAKGHHFPELTLVGIIDIDGSLYSADFRASERMAQLFVQVSGRAGREKSKGKVILQTHFPEHPLLKTLVKGGYEKFARELLKERRQALLPPYSYLALIRCESHQQNHQQDFLRQTANLVKQKSKKLQVYGPYPAPIEKRAGKYRMQLLVLSENRNTIKQVMTKCGPLIENMPSSKKVRWSLDIDPQDML